MTGLLDTGSRALRDATFNRHSRGIIIWSLSRVQPVFAWMLRAREVFRNTSRSRRTCRVRAQHLGDQISLIEITDASCCDYEYTYYCKSIARTRTLLRDSTTVQYINGSSQHFVLSSASAASPPLCMQRRRHYLLQPLGTKFSRTLFGVPDTLVLEGGYRQLGLSSSLSTEDLDPHFLEKSTSNCALTRKSGVSDALVMLSKHVTCFVYVATTTGLDGRVIWTAENNLLRTHLCAGMPLWLHCTKRNAVFSRADIPDGLSKPPGPRRWAPSRQVGTLRTCIFPFCIATQSITRTTQNFLFNPSRASILAHLMQFSVAEYHAFSLQTGSPHLGCKSH